MRTSFFCSCSMLSAVWIQIAKEESWGTKKVPRSWFGKLRKCYLQEDVCYTAFSPKPQFLSSRVTSKIRFRFSSNETRCFWPGWWWTYHSRGSELHGAAKCRRVLTNPPGCWLWCDPNCKELKKILENGSVDEAEWKGIGQLDAHCSCRKVYMIQHQNTSDLVRWYWIFR